MNLFKARDNSTWAVSWLAELTVTSSPLPPFPPLLRVSVPKTSVCRFKTSPCVPAPRPHVVTHVLVVPVHTGTYRIYTPRFFLRAKPRHTPHHTQHNTTHHTTPHGDRDRETQRQRQTETERHRDRDRQKQRKKTETERDRERETKTRQEKRRRDKKREETRR